MRFSVKLVKINRFSRGYQIIPSIFNFFIPLRERLLLVPFKDLKTLCSSNQIPNVNPYILSLNQDPEHRDLNQLLAFLKWDLSFKKELIEKIKTEGEVTIRIIEDIFWRINQKNLRYLEKGFLPAYTLEHLKKLRDSFKFKRKNSNLILEFSPWKGFFII